MDCLVTRERVDHPGLDGTCRMVLEIYLNASNSLHILAADISSRMSKGL